MNITYRCRWARLNTAQSDTSATTQAITSPINRFIPNSGRNISLGKILLSRQTPANIIVFGLGSGDFLQPLLETLSDTSIIVVDPAPQAVKLFIDSRKYLMLEKYEDRLSVLAFDKLIHRNFEVACYSNYKTVYSGELAIFDKIISLMRQGVS